MRYLALDLGAKRTGIAVAAERGSIIFPRAAIIAKNFEQLKSAIFELIEKDGIEETVVGLPLSADGSYNAQTVKTEKIARQIFAGSEHVFIFENEYGSSKGAHEIFKSAGLDFASKKGAKAGIVDSSAAVLILENYFNRLQNEHEDDAEHEN